MGLMRAKATVNSLKFETCLKKQTTAAKVGSYFFVQALPSCDPMRPAEKLETYSKWKCPYQYDQLTTADRLNRSEPTLDFMRAAIPPPVEHATILRQVFLSDRRNSFADSLVDQTAHHWKNPHRAVQKIRRSLELSAR